MDRLVWHYTELFRAYMIVRDGQIRASEVGVGPGEQAVVWFTTASLPDPTMSRQRAARVQVEDTFGPHSLETVRIAVRRQITIPFRHHVMDEGARDALVRVGHNRGANARDWYCHVGAVPASAFAALEHDDKLRWLAVTFAQLEATIPVPARGLTVQVDVATGRGFFAPHLGNTG